MSFVLSCCSTADLTKEHFEKRNIQYVCFHYELDGVTYPDDLGQTMPFDKFYQAMVDGADTRTSQVNAEEYIEYLEKFLSAGKDVLHLTLSGGLSGTINSARIAAEELQAKYPERKLYVLDSFTVASGFGLLMDKLADLRDEGKNIDEIRDWAEANKNKLHHWFFSSDLTFFIKGGRVSKLSGWFGTALHICPLLNVNNEGKLIPREKHRGKAKVIRQIVKKMEEHAQGGLDYSGKCYLSHSACLEDAQAVAKLIEERFHKLNGKVEIYSIGTTIGSHTGPGTVALFFWGDERTL
jgi:DegV family protein with EDD domain